MNASDNLKPKVVSNAKDYLTEYINIQGFFNDEIIESGSISETGIELNHSLKKTDKPWFYKFSIMLENLSDEDFIASTDDSLVIRLGPIPYKDGIKCSLSVASKKPNIEAVALVENNVLIRQLQLNQSFDLPWSANNTKWAGLQDRYYALLIFPASIDEQNKQDVALPFSHYFVNSDFCNETTTFPGKDFPVLSFSTPVSSVDAGEQSITEFLIFSGPKSLEALSSGPVNIRALLFHELPDWMRWVCFGLLWLLNAIFFIIPNWGLAIIFLALVVRLILYPLAKKAMKSQQRFVAAQKKMQPELTEIKKNYKGGEQSERILELYKKYQVSPFAGLKPLLIVLVQLPVLIALYHVLGSVYELQDAGFLWFDSLAEPDKLFYLGFDIPVLGSYFNLLPLLMAAFTMLSFKLSPAPTADKKDSVSQKIFMPLMALSFFILFYSFPSGMVLYWTMANVFHFAQQKLMLRYS